MKNPNKYSSITVFFLMLLFLFCAFVPVKAYSQVDPCMEGLAVPPFLGEGFDPDLLLLIDNSGSMLDLAYVDPDSQCFDENTYDSEKTYTGYFEKEV